MKDVNMEKVFAEIKRQTGYQFTYIEEHLQKTKKVTINIKNADLKTVLDLCVKDQPVTYEIRGKNVIIHEKLIKSTSTPPTAPVTKKITVNVQNENGQPIEDAELTFEGSVKLVSSNVKGNLTFEKTLRDTVFIVSAVGYVPQQIVVGNGTSLNVKMSVAVKTLDEAVVIGYGKTSLRYNTGAVNKIAGSDIEKVAGNNILTALAGRVPGLLITQGTGLSGGLIKSQLRGQSSIGTSPGILPPDDPLYVIDGVPFAPNNNSLQIVTSGSALGVQGRSPFGVINLGDIESVEVLKDADATAIYGSRGANGIILITTKQGQPGKTTYTVNAYTGVGQITRSPQMLNTGQYLQMRREAIKNDSLTVGALDTSDLMNTTTNTDLGKLLIGNTAKINDVQASVSGGSVNTQYLLGANYHKETTVYPTGLGGVRNSFHFRLGHNSPNRKLGIRLSANYSSDDGELSMTDLTNSIALPPNIPLHDSMGKLNWKYDNDRRSFSNPLAYLSQKYHYKTGNALASLFASYKITPNLSAKVSVGYNGVTSTEKSSKPVTSLNPFVMPNTASAYWGNNNYETLIVEPQAEYYLRFKKGKVTALVGGTWHQLKNNVQSTTATGYASDENLFDTSYAGNVKLEKKTTLYRYQGIFGRLSFNWLDKYLLNITGRRDGSSRFGPQEQFGNFYSAGAAWLFSNEARFKKHLPFISFGKLRASYGLTGNDQIGDYKYFDSWARPGSGNTGNTGLIPTQLSYGAYSWETTRKLEGALEVGLFKDRIYLTVDYYNNRTGNQIISLQLPFATGFNSIAAKNSRAAVRNTGFEISMRSRNIETKNVTWSTELALTIPKNKLISFPGLEASRYTGFTVGRSLTFQRGYRYLGVDPVSGFFSFEDRAGDGLTPQDYVDIGNLDPQYYGGINNNISYKNWRLEVFLEGRKQMGSSYLNAIYSTMAPGMPFSNQPVDVLDRWQKAGDRASFQQYTVAKQQGTFAVRDFLQSSGRFADASFIRLKTLTLKYAFGQKWLQKTPVKNASIYFQAQNLFTIPGYKMLDPETQSLYTLPPLKIIATGIQCSF